MAIVGALTCSLADDRRRRAVANAITFTAIASYWEYTHRFVAPHWRLPDLPADVDVATLTTTIERRAREIGNAASALGAAEASYLLGVLYTATLPGKIRATYGAYYTPPALCERLLDMATEAGVDWRTARVLDPACGGGAFLSPVARRMASSLADCPSQIALRNIVRRLRGFEVDPVAAWMSQVFLEITLGNLCRSAGTRLPPVVDVCDSLERDLEANGFDLVIGNPPYGRVTLAAERRRKFRRSLYGHANLYGIFTDLALRLTRHGGTIAYVTPTSFLAGEYFKALRALLGQEAPPHSIDFISERKGVFAGVLQETLLAVYRRDHVPRACRVHFISPSTDGGLSSTPAGSFRVPKTAGQPWLVPRTSAHREIVTGAARMPHRLAHYGYEVSTGPLVWNRHKSSLRNQPAKGRHPLIWAESVRANGTFEFRAEKRNHAPYFEPKPDEAWVVSENPCVLVQRTTAKEQSRRIIAAELPASFLTQHRRVVVENHLNMIRPIRGRAPLVSPRALASLLNTSAIDELFRCMSGSVAVSAFELEALPLPSPEAMVAVERLVARGAGRNVIEDAVRRFYCGAAD